MKIPPWGRLLLYNAMAMVPVWVDFFKLSTDYSFRGLMIPALSSIVAGVTVTLARTTSTGPQEEPAPHEDPPAIP